MDGLTQGLLGAVAAQAVVGDKLGRRAAWIGFAAGAAPDLDILIRSSTDPMLALECHRHFTHALLAIPLGGLLVGTLAWLLARRRIAFWQALLAATVGWASHGVLDATTSYGTSLLWPFSDARLAWDWMGIIDLFITAPLLIGMVLALKRRSPWPARIALAAAVLYMGYGAVQHGRAQSVQQRLAAARGHDIERGRVLPSPLTLSLWRSIYVHGDRMVADAVWVGPTGEPRVWPGSSVARFDPRRALPELEPDAVLARDLRRFAHFTDGYVFVHRRGDGLVLGDFRYSLLPGGAQPLWGIRFDPQRPAAHVDRVRYEREPSARLGRRLLGLLTGEAPGEVRASALDAADLAPRRVPPAGVPEAVVDAAQEPPGRQMPLASQD